VRARPLVDMIVHRPVGNVGMESALEWTQTMVHLASERERLREPWESVPKRAHGEPRRRG
jgi:hypothetical protein